MTAIETTEEAPPEQARELAPATIGTAFSSIQAFEGAQRMAKLLASSDLVPAQYKNNIPNSIIALEMAQRLDMNPLMVMQNLYMVHNRPAWSSQFLIACVNGCGRFSSLHYELTGAEGSDDRTCIAWAYDKANKEKLLSPPVSIRIAKAEGWYGRTGSKWQTMPELMLRYRAATFFARTYAPELTMGMAAKEEVEDIAELHEVQASVVNDSAPSSKAQAVLKKIQERRMATPAEEREADKAIAAQAEHEEQAKATEPATPKPTEPPKAYVTLSREYDTREKMVEECLKEVGLPPMFEIQWQALDAIGLAKLDRAASKLTKKKSE